MRILAIGGTGFIGRFVLKRLVDSGHEVAVVHRGKRRIPERAHEILGARSELVALRGRFREWAPEVAIDFILSSAAQARMTVSAVRGIARRVVAISSGDVYRAMAVFHRLDPGPVEPVPLRETSALRRETRPYPAEVIAGLRGTFPWVDDEYEKIEVEQAIGTAAELPATIVRLPMVYGPGDPLHRLFPLIQRMRDRRPAILQERSLSEWIPCRGYVENVAHGIALAATSEVAAGRVYNLDERLPVTEAARAMEIGSAAGWSGRVVPMTAERTPKHLAARQNFAQHLFMDSTKIRTELGYAEPVELREALRRTVEWEAANLPEKMDAAAFDYAAEDAALAE